MSLSAPVTCTARCSQGPEISGDRQSLLATVNLSIGKTAEASCALLRRQWPPPDHHYSQPPPHSHQDQSLHECYFPVPSQPVFSLPPMRPLALYNKTSAALSCHSLSPLILPGFFSIAFITKHIFICSLP